HRTSVGAVDLKRAGDDAPQPIRAAPVCVRLIVAKRKQSAPDAKVDDRAFPLPRLVRPKNRDRRLDHVPVETRRVIECKRQSVENCLNHAEPPRAACFWAFVKWQSLKRSDPSGFLPR